MFLCGIAGMEYESLIVTDSDCSINEELLSKRLYRRKRLSLWHWCILGLTTLLLASNMGWYLLLRKLENEGGPCRSQLVYSPALEAIRYQRKTLWRSIENDNPYTGQPRLELDQAWHELMRPMTTKISSREIDRIGESSIALADGSGFVAELAVYHELHCIKRVRRHLHLDYYYPNMTEAEQKIEDTHMDHCLEYWREAAMCRGDPALATFVWVDGTLKSRLHSDHTCIDWESLAGWATSRKVDLSDPGVVSRVG